MWVWKILLIISTTFMLLSCNAQYDYTAEEKEYIQTQTVLWASADNFYPFIYIDTDGQSAGISKDYMNLITKKTGLKFTMASHGQLMDQLDQLKHGSIEMITSIRTTPERAVYASFTRPYIFADTVMIKRTNIPRNVGIGKGYAVKNYLEIERKDLKIVEFENDEQAFKEMQRGDIDSVVVDAVSAKFLIKKYRAMYDVISVPYEYPLSFAVRKDDARLRVILDKAIASITPEEHTEIRRKWM